MLRHCDLWCVIDWPLLPPWLPQSASHSTPGKASEACAHHTAMDSHSSRFPMVRLGSAKMSCRGARCCGHGWPAASKESV